MDIVALLHCLQSGLPATTIRQLSRIALSLLTITGRVTMAGIARWGGDGTSSHTVQRFFATVVPWPQRFWLVFRHHRFQPDDVSILAGDAVVVTKAGKTTFGLDRFCSSIYRKAVPSVAFLSRALVSTNVSRRFPVSRTDTVRYCAQAQ